MKYKRKINKFIRNYDNTVEEQAKTLVKLKDKNRLIRLENDIEAKISEYKELYRNIKDYIVPYLDFIAKYEEKLFLAQEVNNHINHIGR